MNGFKNRSCKKSLKRHLLKSSRECERFVGSKVLMLKYHFLLFKNNRIHLSNFFPQPTSSYEKIALRRLTTLETRLDGLISKLGATEQKSSKKSTDPKGSKKDSKTNFSKKVKAVVLPKVQPVSLPKKTIPAASLTKKSTKNLDLVIQVNPTSEPVFLLAAIKSLQLAKSNVCIRVHYHSSVIKQDEAGYKLNSLLSAFDLGVNADTSRKVVSFDYRALIF